MTDEPDPLERLPAVSPPSARSRDANAILRAAFDAFRRGGRITANALADAVDGAARVLVRRVINGVLDDPQPVPSEQALADALASRSEPPALGQATAAMLAARLARRLGPWRGLFGRTPMWLVAAAVPAFYTSIVRGADELELVASHLVHRARAAGVEPDAERLRRMSVQVLSGDAADPGAEPRHGRLAVRWMRRAGRAVLPFSRGIATRDPVGIAAAAAAVPPSALARAN
jgi:hypothetical protein